MGVVRGERRQREPGPRAGRGRTGAWARGTALALALAAAAVHATSPALVEQKLRLLEGYFDSDTATRLQESGSRQAMDALGDKAWQPQSVRPRKVSAALKVYAKMATSADKGAVRDLSLLD